MESPADRQAAVEKVASVLLPRRRPETIPDLSDSLDAGEKAAQECVKRDTPGGNHRPKGFGKIIRPPAELIGIVESVGEKLCCVIGRGLAGVEGLMIANGVDDARTFIVLKG
jgi:hypothetical protein